MANPTSKALAGWAWQAGHTQGECGWDVEDHVLLPTGERGGVTEDQPWGGDQSGGHVRAWRQVGVVWTGSPQCPLGSLTLGELGWDGASGIRRGLGSSVPWGPPCSGSGRRETGQ